MKASSISTFLALLFLASPLLGENWPNWRGPYFNGSSQEKNYPAVFSKTDGVAWQSKLPGEGASTPIVWEDSVFLTSIDESKKGIVGICIDAKTGEIQWSKKFGDGMRHDERSTFSGSSPVTEGETVFFFSGAGKTHDFLFS